MNKYVDELFRKYSEDEIYDILNSHIDIKYVVYGYFSINIISQSLNIDKSYLENIDKVLYTKEELNMFYPNNKVKCPKIYLINTYDLVDFIMEFETRDKVIKKLKEELKFKARTARIY